MCLTPGCKYTSPREDGWYCTLTKGACVAAPKVEDSDFEFEGEKSKIHAVSLGSEIYNEELGKQYPGYNLPKEIAKFVKLFRKKGTPKSLQEKMQEERR